MSLRAELRRTAPWVLCAVSLSMYTVSNVLRFLLRNDVPAPDPGWVEGTIGALGFAGIPIVGALMAVPLLAFTKSFIQYLHGAAEPPLTRLRWPSGSHRA